MAIHSNEQFISPADPRDVGPNWRDLSIQPQLSLEEATEERFAYLEGYAGGQKAAAFIMGEVVAEQSAKVAEMRERSLIDPLTGIGNRRYMEESYRSLITPREYQRISDTQPAHELPNTALVIDLDHFRDINTAAGHAGGDMVLKAVADRIRDTVRREGDVLARIGGDELAVILPSTDTDIGVELAERIREGLDELRIGPKKLRMTASIGVAELAQGETLEEGLRQADIAAYASKESGRNRVTRYDPSLPRPEDQ